MTTLQQELENLTIGAPRDFRNLSLYPVSWTRPSDFPPYLLADDAMRTGVARVTEVNGGSVPELQFENHAKLPVLLIDGEELIGAKQNRVVNLTILVPAQTTLVIPVSCVEAGRWQMVSAEFQPSDNVMFSAARASRVRQVTASLRATGARRSNQSEVWEDIAAKASRMQAASPTQAMSAVFERHANSVEEYVRSFDSVDGQAGVIFATSGAIGIDLFDRPDTLQRLYPKLVRSYALDAIENAGPTRSPDAVRRFVADFGRATVATEPALGLGKDLRLSGPLVAGAALWADGRYVHVCGFSEKGTGEQSPSSRLSRPSRRRSGGTGARS